MYERRKEVAGTNQEELQRHVQIGITIWEACSQIYSEQNRSREGWSKR